MKEEGLKLVLLRNEFYRDNYRKAAMAFLLLIILNAILAAAVFYKMTHPAKPQYFAITDDGKIISLYALSDPMLSNDKVLQWSTVAARKAFALDFLHWREQLQDASNYFTPDGWKYFLTALQQTNNLKTLADLKMVSDATITGAPELLENSVLDGHYAWKIQLPLMVTYQNAERTIPQPTLVTMIVIRMPVEENPDGVAINNFIMDTRGPAS